MQGIPEAGLNVKVAQYVSPTKGPEIPAVQVDQESLKVWTHALRIFSAAMGLTDQPAAATTVVKDMLLGLRIVKMLSTDHMAVLKKISASMSEPTVASFSTLLDGTKRASEFFARPVKLLAALAKYGTINPEIMTFIPDAALSVAKSASEHSRRAKGILGFLGLYQHLTADKINKLGVAESASMVAISVAAHFGWTEAQLVAEVISNTLGLVSIWSREPKGKKSVDPVTTPQILPMQKDFDKLKMDVHHLMENQFREILENVDKHPDEMVRLLIKGDCLQNKSQFEAYVSEANNEHQLHEILSAYKSTFLPGAIEQGLIEPEASKDVNSVFDRSEQGLQRLIDREFAATEDLADYQAFINTHLAALTDWQSKASTEDLKSEQGMFCSTIVDSLVNLRQQSKEYSDGLWNPAKAHPLDPDPVESLKIVDREASLSRIETLTSPGAREFLSLNVQHIIGPKPNAL